MQNKKIWKEDFSASPYFIDEVTAGVTAILQQGMKAAVTALINQ